MNKPVQIDIDKIFQSKNPKLYKLIPGFILRWIKKTIHQEEINEVLRDSVGLSGPEFARKSFQKLGVEISSSGMENIPKHGPIIIASNHPLGGLDGMALISECAKVREDVRFIVNDLLTNLPNFEDVFVGVNKVGAKGREQLKKVEETYATGKCVLIFPAGLCSRKIDGKITDLKWQKSFIGRALRYDIPIIPCFIEGKNSNRFYRLANWRKKFGIKANLEMFFLPDEMFRQKGQNVHIQLGLPIWPQTFTHSHTQDEWAEKLRQFVYTLKDNPHGVFI